MTVVLDDGDVRVHHGDCIHILATLPAGSVDAVVTDPPYGLEFMGKGWDSFGGVRSAGSRGGNGNRGILPGYGRGGASEDRARFHHRSHVAFQAWCEQWAREALRVLKPGGHLAAFGGTRTYHRLTAGLEDAGFEIRDCLTWLYGSGFPKSLDVSKAIDKAAAWDGWGTALKPAWEPIVLARKPLVGTVASNVLQHGTGALNIDGCRIAHANDADLAASLAKNPGRDDLVTSGTYGAGRPQQSVNTAGRWPANVVLDDHAAAMLDEQAGDDVGYGDAGGPSRFYYTAKASRTDRGDTNTHPTVKPTELMRWVIRLVTPPGGVVLDPFAGSGTTGVAARAEGVRCVLIEREDEYVRIIRDRLAQLSLFGEAA